MSIIIPANTLAAGGFDVDNSARFTKASSDYLNRTHGASGSTRKMTISFWIKKCSSKDHGQADGMMILGGQQDDYPGFHLTFLSSTDTLIFRDARASNQVKFDVRTDAKFRDLSAWSHIVFALDTTQGTASNRIKLYVNGIQITDLNGSTASGAGDPAPLYPDQNLDTLFNSNIAHFINKYASNYEDFYLSEFAFIDGSQLAADQFGEFDEDSNIWKPIKVSGLTFGTNGFYLDFKDSSALGNDANGSNNYTSNNFAAINQSTDTCTNNFATINRLDNFYAQAAFSEGNLQIVTSVAAFAPIRSTIGVSSGKWYAEVKIITASATDHEQGVVSQAAVNNSAGVGRIAEGYGYAGNGQVFRNDSQVTYSANSLAADDILGIYLDLDNNKLYFAKNGTIQNSGAGISMVDPASTTDGVYYFATSDNANLSGGSYRFDWNFGNPIFTGTDKSDANGYGSFEYDPSAGTFDSASKDFYALCTKNLAEYG